MSLAKWLRLHRPSRNKLTCYEIPLLTIAQQLPLELLQADMWWVWTSTRSHPDEAHPDPALPDVRPLTLLTPDSAAAFADDFAEHDDEWYRRWILIVGGTNGSRPAGLDQDELKKELQAISESAETCVSVVIFPIGDSEHEELVVDSKPHENLKELVRGVSERVGVTANRLRTSDGGGVMKRVLLGL